MSLKSILITVFIKPLYLLLETVYSVLFKFTNNSLISVIAVAFVFAALLITSLSCYAKLVCTAKKAESEGKNAGKGKALKFIFALLTLAFDVVLVLLVRKFFLDTVSASGSEAFVASYLSLPDALISLSGKTVNVFPITASIISVISAVVFSVSHRKQCSAVKTLPLFALALSLLFFHNAPSAYTICLAAASVLILVKAVVGSFADSELVGAALTALVGIAGAIGLVFFYGDPTSKMKVMYVALGAALQLPLLITLISRAVKNKAKRKKKSETKKGSHPLVFFAGCLFMTIFTGLCIPSSVIVSAPQDFVDINYYHNPLLYVLSAVLIAAGLFIAWGGAYYLMSSEKKRSVLEVIVWIACGFSAVNHFFFGKSFGVMTTALKYENGFDVKLREQGINTLILAAVAALFIFLAIKFREYIPAVMLIGMASITAMSVVNLVVIADSVSPLAEQAKEIREDEPHYTLSKNGKNVIVFMLDRAISVYTPYIFEEKPELKTQFDGFTYYSNTISYGGNTNFASPALFGGYEYTPAEMNARDTELLADKHNEALKVLPVLFDSEGYDVTVFDPSYAGYQAVPDLSIYDEYPDIDAYITKGTFSDNSSKRLLIENNYRNFFCYSIVKSSPLVLQETLYDDGVYNNNSVEFTVSDDEETVEYNGQVADTVYTSKGLEAFFMDAYNVLDNIETIVDADNRKENTFLMMVNTTTHNPILLQEPDYVPSMVVDNREFEEANADRYTYEGRTLRMEKLNQFSHYESNMAAMLQLGRWFDYLRELGVYDNTRIIIVADHGGIMHQLEELELDDGFDLMAYCPLLMVKDFNSTGFTASDEFMTNADTPTLALEGLIDNPTNPFTGKAINSDEKTAHDQYVIYSNDWNIEVNNGKQFLPAEWYPVHDNLWDKSNWTKLADSDILTYEGVK